ncbi:2-dehydro-3-deoxyphosphogluconate aldolase/(4S)-4-hydroxy-2-oxoglutarate aldolase [Elusimicrobium simillimum]|uniref:bifunctional 4-hydroxy-2-oxoglutarate aldolase/2-dehydro-3-deoxy-phosphogluconate aldolase n=1 Tax=Elusimicrobium simillimum TaxID=3143438 RepID=UPI003C6FE048
MNEMLKEISNIGIVPVVVLDDAAQALPLAKALCDGGLKCAEVTFRTAAAEESIKIMAKEMPDMLVGAGTVLTTEQADRAIAAGAKFIVSPGLNPKIVKHCQEKGITIIPGCANPSDVEAALELGLEVVKFFPAEAAGGINMIKAMAAPYTNVKFMPTGGVDMKNLNSYLGFNKVIACGGSWMVNKEYLKNNDYATITKLTREAVLAMLGFELQHIGINMPDIESARGVAAQYEKLFGFVSKEGNGSFFAGTGFEVMKKQFLGKCGHIAIKTNYIERAMYYLKQHGVEFNMETANYDAAGNLMTIYFKEEIGNFALHLFQKK